MGLFDDITSIAQEFNGLKQEITDTVSEAAGSLTDAKNEAAETVDQLKQEATDAKDTLLNNDQNTK